MMNKLELSLLNEDDIPEIVAAFSNIGWEKPRSIYERYIEEQNTNLRTVFIAKMAEKFCGYVTIKWKSDYQPFNLNNVPEISDLNVLPEFRKKGIGSALIQHCESTAMKRGHAEIGLGVGMTLDYGSAQRLYVQLGYMPDGNGLHYNYKAVNYSETVTVDDDLILYFKKQLPQVTESVADGLTEKIPEMNTEVISGNKYTLCKNIKNAFEIIDAQLFAFNKKCVPATQQPELIKKHYVIKENDLIIAGICAEIYTWKILYIELLFVNETHRNQDLAIFLIKKVEEEAKSMGVALAHTDTFDFQAKDFYLKQDYEIFGVLDDCPKGHKRYYLKKSLK